MTPIYNKDGTLFALKCKECGRLNIVQNNDLICFSCSFCQHKAAAFEIEKNKGVQFYTVLQVAAKAGCTGRTVYRAIKAHKLNAHYRQLAKGKYPPALVIAKKDLTAKNIILLGCRKAKMNRAVKNALAKVVA